jgi:hypothetical protein
LEGGDVPAVDEVGVVAVACWGLVPVKEVGRGGGGVPVGSPLDQTNWPALPLKAYVFQMVS